MIENRAVESRKRAEEVRERLAKSVDSIVSIIHGYIDKAANCGEYEIQFEKNTLITDCCSKGGDVENAVNNCFFYEQALNTLRKEGYTVLFDAFYSDDDDVKISWKG